MMTKAQFTNIPKAGSATLKAVASRFSIAFILACFAVLASCAPNFLDESVPFTIVATGQPSDGRHNESVTVAIRGDDPHRAVPDGLPDTAQKALKEILGKPDAALYLVVFDGWKSSTGYRVTIDSVVRRRDAAGERLVVRYHVDSPPPGTGAATVMTYPFAIARVANVNIAATAVMFEGPPHPTPAVQNLPVEWIASGAPTDSGGAEPIAFAMRGDDAGRTIPNQLPTEARDALQKIMAKADSALYLVIYAGRYSTTGYQVGIDFVEWHRVPQSERLVVRYRVDRQSGGPPPSHPFLIARVQSNVQPSAVAFEHP